MSQPSLDDLRALENLLAEHFDGDELRRFAARWYGRTVMMGLPGGASSGTAVVHDLVHVLVRRGKVEENLFGAIIADRPESESQTHALAARFGFTTLPVLAQQRTVGASSDLPAAVVDEVYARLLDDRDAIRALYPSSDAGGLARAGEVLQKMNEDQGAIAREVTIAVQRARRRAYRQVVKAAFGTQNAIELAGLARNDLAYQSIMAGAALLGLLHKLAPFAAATEGVLWIEAHNITREQLADRQ